MKEIETAWGYSDQKKEVIEKRIQELEKER